MKHLHQITPKLIKIQKTAAYLILPIEDKG